MSQEKLKCKFGVLSRPNGSVMMCEGETTCLAGLYGPVEVRAKNILIDKACVEAYYRPKSGLPGVQDKFYESIIRNICETTLVASLHPRSSIIIVLQEMHNSGQLISCAVNAACLAALHSGIEMKFMFAAVSCFLSYDDDLHLISESKEADYKALFVFVFSSLNEKLIASHTEGSFSVEKYEEALDMCRKESRTVLNFFKTALLKLGDKNK